MPETKCRKCENKKVYKNGLCKRCYHQFKKNEKRNYFTRKLDME